MRAAAWCLPCLLLAGILAGCAGAPQRTPRSELPQALPSVPPPPPDAAATPDAVPRWEPRSKYGNPASYEVFGQRYVILPSAEGYVARGIASWYGPGFHGERTSSGEPYDMYAMTAAHKTLPIPVYARVTNLANGRSVVVRINDRGPFVGDRLIDLSWSAASRLDMLRGGTTPVEVRVLSPGEKAATDATAASTPPAISATPPVSAPTPTQAPTQTPTATPAVSAPVASVPAVAAPGDGSWLQAGSFSDVTNAKKLLQRLADSGIHNAQIVEFDVGGRRVWRVRVGPIASREELDDYIERLALFGIPDARLAHD